MKKKEQSELIIVEWKCSDLGSNIWVKKAEELTLLPPPLGLFLPSAPCLFGCRGNWDIVRKLPTFLIHRDLISPSQLTRQLTPLHAKRVEVGTTINQRKGSELRSHLAASFVAPFVAPTALRERSPSCREHGAVFERSAEALEATSHR